MSAEVADAHKAALMVRDILEGFEGIVKNMVTELEARFVAHHTTIVRRVCCVLPNVSH